MKEYKIGLWKETKMPFGIGLERLHDERWPKDQLNEKCCNAKVIDRLKGINAIYVIKRLDGTFYVNQVCGYTDVTGLYGYTVNPDNTLDRFI